MSDHPSIASFPAAETLLAQKSPKIHTSSWLGRRRGLAQASFNHPRWCRAPSVCPLPVLAPQSRGQFHQKSISAIFPGKFLIKTEDFDARLAGLGIPNKKVRRVIAVRTVRKTLELSDAMLSIFHLSIRTNPEWAKHAVSDTLVKTSTVRYNLFQTFTGPTSNFGI